MCPHTCAQLITCVQVGEFLGSHQGLGMATMHAYIDQEDFSGMAIDAALRQLLNGFRLPGTLKLKLSRCLSSS